MEHIFFEVQLCLKISIFKEKHVFDIPIILCLMTSLYLDDEVSVNAKISMPSLVMR